MTFLNIGANTMSDDLLQRAEAFIEIEVKTLPLQVQLNGITDAEKAEAASICKRFAAAEIARERANIADELDQMRKTATDILYCLDGFRGESNQSNYGEAGDWASQTRHQTNKMLKILNDPKLTELYQCDVSDE
jgi:hypothetical protein